MAQGVSKRSRDQKLGEAGVAEEDGAFGTGGRGGGGVCVSLETFGSEKAQTWQTSVLCPHLCSYQLLKAPAG